MVLYQVRRIACPSWQTARLGKKHHSICHTQSPSTNCIAGSHLLPSHIPRWAPHIHRIRRRTPDVPCCAVVWPPRASHRAGESSPSAIFASEAREQLCNCSYALPAAGFEMTDQRLAASTMRAEALHAPAVSPKTEGTANCVRRHSGSVSTRGPHCMP